MQIPRRQLAETVRVKAAALAASRPIPRHENNGEEQSHRTAMGSPSYIANFTKGLPHDISTGLVLNPVDYKLFITGIQTGNPDDFRATPLGPGKLPDVPNFPSVESIPVTQADRRCYWESDFAKGIPFGEDSTEKGARVRAWESAGAGQVMDLQGPDAQSVTMPPAPKFGSSELLGEIAELYAMALTRDIPFEEYPFKMGGGSSHGALSDTGLKKAHKFLGELSWFIEGPDETDTPDAYGRVRTLDEQGLDLFRGVTPGVDHGPYLSQFLLLGNNSLGEKTDKGLTRRPEDGFVRYGAMGIQQKVREAEKGKDYLTLWSTYIDAQNGADFRGMETYAPASKSKSANSDGHRFIATPRDLATYVHYDALYEAYLNACIFLLESKAPFDRGIPFLEFDAFDKQQGFAHFGGPHILTLVCEVATRALKAVRYQKFNIHRRLRPEAMGGLFDRWMNCSELRDGDLLPFKPIAEELSKSKWGTSKFTTVLKGHNHLNNEHFSSEKDCGSDSYLLPMAFPEGSPMHPSYGAGHATVAGACVTILKAYFDHGWTPSEFTRSGGKGKPKVPVAWIPSADGKKLNRVDLNRPLTVEGELNKLAANIAIGRNWAGVHYYSDYIESLRMGEEIAIGLLEEQKTTFPENFSMTIPLFDGGAVQI